MQAGILACAAEAAAEDYAISLPVVRTRGIPVVFAAEFMSETAVHTPDVSEVSVFELQTVAQIGLRRGGRSAAAVGLGLDARMDVAAKSYEGSQGKGERRKSEERQ
jgi:hypothetical protein